MHNSEFLLSWEVEYLVRFVNLSSIKDKILNMCSSRLEVSWKGWKSLHKMVWSLHLTVLKCFQSVSFSSWSTGHGPFSLDLKTSLSVHDLQPVCGAMPLCPLTTLPFLFEPLLSINVASCSFYNTSRISSQRHSCHSHVELGFYLNVHSWQWLMWVQEATSWLHPCCTFNQSERWFCPLCSGNMAYHIVTQLCYWLISKTTHSHWISGFGEVARLWL